MIQRKPLEEIEKTIVCKADEIQKFIFSNNKSKEASNILLEYANVILNMEKATQDEELEKQFIIIENLYNRVRKGLKLK